MIFSHSLDRAGPLSSPFPRNANPNRDRSCSHRFQWRFSQSSTGNFSQKSLCAPKFQRNQVTGDAPKLRFASTSVRLSQSGGFEPLIPESELQNPSFLEFMTSERVKVVAMLGLALALCNADRVVMSVAIVPLSKAHGWTQSFSGIVQSSFLWGYLLSPIVGGALVDYYGGKVVMAWGVTLWLMATFLTPWGAETSLWALLSMRILLGVAEGGAPPSMNNMVLRWFPQVERSGAVGLAMGGFNLGSAIGLLISPVIMSKTGIFGPFVIFGLFGFLWFIVWLSAISSTPARHPSISRYELEYIDKTQKPSMNHQRHHGQSTIIPPFKKLLSKLPTWALISANAMHSWGYFVILSWMPVYFNTIYHVNLRQAAWFSALPWAMMAILGYAAGAMSDMLIQSGRSVTFTRKVMQEIAPQYAGVLHGMSNTAGTLAAMVGTIGAGFCVERMGSFHGFLVFTSFLYFIATLFWDFVSTGELVDFDGTSQ